MRLFERFWRTRLAAWAFEGAQATDWWKKLYEELIAAAGPEQYTPASRPEQAADVTSSPQAPAGTLLDVGCGEGLGTRAVAAKFERAVGVDISSAMVRRAQVHAQAEDVENVEYRQADAHRLPFGDDTFDVVTATSVVYLSADPAAVLKEMARVCKPGGRVASFDPSDELTLLHALRNLSNGEVTGRNAHLAAFFFLGWVGSSRVTRRISTEHMRSLLAEAGLTLLLLEKRHAGVVLFTVAT